jgi:hypothetical protein
MLFPSSQSRQSPKKAVSVADNFATVSLYKDERPMSKDAKCLFSDNYEEYILMECGPAYSDTNLSTLRNNVPSQ